MGNNLYIEILIGAILITVYAHERFNTPPHVRASTTAARYYLASITYLMVYLISFFVLTKYPYLLEKLKLVTPPAGDVSKDSGSTPIIVAMVLSLLVPKIPLISSLDAKLKKFLHRLAAIPFEAFRLSQELQECNYQIPGKLNAGHEHTQKLFNQLKEQGYEQPQLLVDSNLAFMKTWTKLTSLMIQLKGWESSSQFSAFVQERAGQLERIKDHYLRLSGMVRNAFFLNQEMAIHKELNAELSKVFNNVTNKFDADMSNEQKALYSELCDFISHGMLKTCFMGSSRARTLSSMGFEGIQFNSRTVFSVNSTITLFGLLLVLVLVNSILFQPRYANNAEAMSRTEILLMITMVVSIYSAAVICAVVPKQLWSNFRSSEKHEYPAAAYAASGVIAVLASLVISLAFKTLLFALDPQINGFTQPFTLAWKNFSTSAYPWLIMSFVCTLSLAFLIDLPQPKWVHHKWQRRVLDGVIQTAALVCAVSLVHWWLAGLAQTGAFSGRLPALPQLIRLSVLIGFVLGYFVPTWYRVSTMYEVEPSATDNNARTGVQLKQVV